MYTVLKRQKEDVYNLIKQAGLDFINFEWIDVQSNSSEETISQLSYRDTDYFFRFDFSSNLKYPVGYYSPGFNKRIEQTPLLDTWGDLVPYVDTWLAVLKKELETADPWEEIKDYIPGAKVDLENEESNSPFSVQQFEYIEAALRRVELEIKNSFKLTDIQVKCLEDKLNYLIDRAKRFGRVDWKNIFVATIIQIAISLALPPDKMPILWELVKGCFKGMPLLIFH